MLLASVSIYMVALRESLSDKLRLVPWNEGRQTNPFGRKMRDSTPAITLCLHALQKI